METKITQIDIDFIELVRSQDKNYTKKTIVTLKNISKLIWTQEEVDIIFDVNDTCYCSATLRTTYKSRFLIKYDEQLNIMKNIY